MTKTFMFLTGGALVTAGGLVFFGSRAAKTKQATVDAVNGASADVKAKIDAAQTPADVQAAVAAAVPEAPPDVTAAAAAGDTDTVKASSWYQGQIQLRLTGYWPWEAAQSGDAAEKNMEGGVNDRKGKPLHSVEDFFAGKSAYVSLSGDDKAWPWGQRVDFVWSDGRKVIGRVVDTGRNFRGSTKVYRAAGNEPLDVAVRSKSTHPPTFVTGTIVKGDTLEKTGAAVVDTSKFQGQSVVVGRLSIGLIGLDLMAA